MGTPKAPACVRLCEARGYMRHLDEWRAPGGRLAPMCPVRTHLETIAREEPTMCDDDALNRLARYLPAGGRVVAILMIGRHQDQRQGAESRCCCRHEAGA